LTHSLSHGEWHAFPAPSVFSLAAAHLGWRLEDTRCLGLHAAPLASLRAHLQPSARLIVTLRDGAAVPALCDFLVTSGHPNAQLWIMDSLGGPSQNIRPCFAHETPPTDIGPLVTVALLMPRTGPFVALAPGRPDADFAHDGQITKSPVRAVTLSALAPKANELLWDLGAGSGSISIEWCLAGGRAIAVEAREDRMANIQQNIADFGLAARMTAVHGQLPDAVETLPPPDAVFVGGGFSEALMQRLVAAPKGTRLVVNSVTLETESLVSALQARYGGTLMRMDFAMVEPLGRYRGWQTTRPVVQWSVTL
jgi:precorrin-6Y C5,15-methyltransferase (decarboxylating)